MRFANVNNERCEARPGLTGFCPVCGGPVLARCGEQRIQHWAYRGTRHCDHWWESETPWHRGWKNHFPKVWQERVHYDRDGEKHVADVKTPQGAVVEFQYSYLKSQERISREQFYGKMVWVVSGTRRKRDRKRFSNARETWERLLNGLYITSSLDVGVPAEWRDSDVPVCFDFGKNYPLLWCLLPKRAKGHAVIVAMRKDNFIKRCRQGMEILDTDELIGVIEDVIAHSEQRVALARQRVGCAPHPPTRISRRPAPSFRRWRRRRIRRF